MSVSSPPPARAYRYYAFCMVGFVTVLLCSNLIGPGKVCTIAGLSFGAGNLFFPIGYIFGDVLTEVYGYARARKVIWAGFVAMGFATVMTQFVIRAPFTPGDNAELQPALEIVFGNTWRVALGSMIAFWAGDFVNSYVMARMKVWTEGRHMWTRTIGSTAVGQFVDSAIFYPFAFLTLQPSNVRAVIGIVMVNWLFKLVVEIVFTPVTYLVVNWLKRAEQEDYYDEDTNFTPFSLRD